MSGLGPKRGIAHGWMPDDLSPEQVFEVFGRDAAWVDARARGGLVEWRAWSVSGSIRRVDAVFGDGSLLSVRRLRMRVSVHIGQALG